MGSGREGATKDPQQVPCGTCPSLGQCTVFSPDFPGADLSTKIYLPTVDLSTNTCSPTKATVLQGINSTGDHLLHSTRKWDRKWLEGYVCEYVRGS